MLKKYSSLKVLALTLAPLVLSGCFVTLETKGNFLSQMQLSALKVGLSKPEVIKIIGSPSSVAPFDENTWYYIGSKTGTVAFLRPETIELQITGVQFGPQGRVKKITFYDPKQAKEIELSSRTTPTVGHERTFVQQIMGNVGRFSRNKKE